MQEAVPTFSSVEIVGVLPKRGFSVSIVAQVTDVEFEVNIFWSSRWLQGQYLDFLEVGMDGLYICVLKVSLHNYFKYLSSAGCSVDSLINSLAGASTLHPPYVKPWCLTPVTYTPQEPGQGQAWGSCWASPHRSLQLHPSGGGPVLVSAIDRDG